MTTREWDAETYDRVADAQEAWGREVLERLELGGEETVLDAGCGTGRVTRALIQRLPRGRVVAVDASRSMVEKAGQVLRPGDRAIVADLAELELDEPVDAVLSTSVFHWLPDHDRLFRRMHDALRPGGVLEAQCGGEGNIAALHAAARRVGDREPFERWLAGWDGPWNFSSADLARRRLERAGFTDARCWLEGRDVRPDEPQAFVRVVCLGPHLEQLPEDLHERYIDEVLAETGEPLRLEYVRLNLSARRPG